MSRLERELVIQATPQGCEIALLENKELVEFHRDSNSTGLTIGDIYWARVQKILPPMNAVFVDIGEEKEGFLHYTDLGENFPSISTYFRKCTTKEIEPLKRFSLHPPLPKEGKIASILQVNDHIPVQVLKEPMNTKGARLSSDISLAGRFLVLVPFSDAVSVSKKISNAIERERLTKLCRELKHPKLGLIIRTVAEDKSVKEIHEDYLQLVEKWDIICKKLANASGITRLYEEESKSNTLLRDILNDSFTKIHVNTRPLASSIQSYIEKIAPEKVNIIKTHENTPYLFEEFKLTSKIKSSFNKIIPLKSGGYIILERTEAMYVIDVNSGINVAKKGLDSKESILKVNLEAAKEIARQLRLRDIGGIIVIDFIDSKDQDVKERVFLAMQEYMQSDKASHTILPLSKFCVMQITRSRTRPQEVVITREECPSCQGTGKITSSILITDMIWNKLQSMASVDKRITLIVHPFVESYLRQGVVSLYMRWQWRLRRRFTLISNSSLGINMYEILDEKCVKITDNLF